MVKKEYTLTDKIMIIVPLLLIIGFFVVVGTNWSNESHDLFCQEKGFEYAEVYIFGGPGLICCKLNEDPDKFDVCEKFKRR